VASEATKQKDACNVAERMARRAVTSDQPSSTLCKNLRKSLARSPVVTAKGHLLGNVSTMHILAAVANAFEETETEQRP
jgi:hypothetical protein